MKKAVLFLLFISILLCGCDAASIPETVSNNVDVIEKYESYEIQAKEYEQVYLESGEKEDLKKLCSELSVMRLDKPEFFQMVIKYFPVLFSEFNVNDMNDVYDYGFDSFFSTYVLALMAEDQKGEFREKYYEFKAQAQNIYYYASSIYPYVLQLKNLNEEDKIFLYDEAVSLLNQAKKDNVDFHSKVNAYVCILGICENMGRQEEWETIGNEYKELIENYKKTMGLDDITLS